MNKKKSTVEEIRQRFDADVERFSNLETGQSATIDAPLALELIANAAASSTPAAKRALDIGCGAGNLSLRLLSCLSLEKVTLLDLSAPMLSRAEQRIRATHSTDVQAMQRDVREAQFEDSSFDIILAGAVLHHLRSDEQWETMFTKFHRWLTPGGSIWIFDLVTHPNVAVQQLMQERYGQYLVELKDASYRDAVFAYIDQEDSPRPIMYQLDLLRRVGFRDIDLLHYNTCFAAFGAVR